MILFSDRCAVSDEAKRKIVDNIVHALSDFVEIESEEKVQINVATDDVDEAGSITNVEYKDTLDGSVDVRFDFLCSTVVYLKTSKNSSSLFKVTKTRSHSL
ncbi:BnaC06g43460D [Brassica napus]|uniref:(rape) hypothetical protein n=1 Tax=Brassica napus TaxID=3708 RepID=A0A078IKD6_BRANA|nr:unnamed protein product [Brassica napus]CDY51505.1 BnaC06g43460D [Brassica napus]